MAITAQRLVELTCPYCIGDCSPLCLSYDKAKRASVFELLSGKSLASALGEIRGDKSIDHYQTLRQVIRKGIALGYIKESEYDRWVYSE